MEPAPEAATAAIVRKHLARDGLNLTEARLLRRIQRGDVPRQPTNAETVAFGVLKNADLIRLVPAEGATSHDNWAITDEVAYSIGLDTADGRHCRTTGGT